MLLYVNTKCIHTKQEEIRKYQKSNHVFLFQFYFFNIIKNLN